jgi:hypothetical protein
MKASHRADRTGRSRGLLGKFVALPDYMLRTAAWHAVSFPATKALIELLRIYNGSNNGELAMAASTLAQRLGCSKTHAARTLAELEEKGFIVTEKIGTFRRKDRLASEYSVTMYRNDLNGEHATKQFMRWSPPPTVPKNRVTVPPAVRKQQNCRSQSRPWDPEGENQSVNGPARGTHLDIYHRDAEAGSRSAPIGSAVASEPAAEPSATLSDGSDRKARSGTRCHATESVLRHHRRPSGHHTDRGTE